MAGKKGKRTLRVGSGNEKRRKMMMGGKKRMMNNVRSLKENIAYDPNQRSSRKDDQYCASLRN
jgi:hypothetical protein